MTKTSTPSDPTALPRSSAPLPSRRRLHKLKRAFTIKDLRQQASRSLPRAVFDFYDGGAESESTLRKNSEAFDRIEILPRHLTDVSQIDISCQLLGKKASMPLAVSPTGAIGYGWPFGDVAIARAAGAAGVPFALPTSSTSSIERVAQEAPQTRLWFQSYMLRKREFTLSLIERARVAGYEALIITVDMPTGGKRERDLHNDFGLPFRFTARNMLDFASRPAWVARLLRTGLPALENLVGFDPEVVDTAAIASTVGKNYDPSFNWDDLAMIRDAWPGALLIKGILHPADALRVLAIGCDGLIVSNHGGRQLDGAIASLDALPAIAQEVGSQIPVILDGGIRKGSDILKALSSGAHAVMAGRPFLYGVSAAGQSGAERVLTILREELERNMRLSGVSSLEAIAHLSTRRG